jgi:citrate lyase beta subunit
MSQIASSFLRRALLYVPASSTRFLEKSRALAVDLCVYDLEDSVTTSNKPQARRNVRQLLSQPKGTGIREQAVRINSVESGLALDDLNEVVRSAFCLLPRLPILPGKNFDCHENRSTEAHIASCSSTEQI